ncbi:MAG: reverse transcriptase-like protein [bacterium]|nr:reverse transcriptase-like protein [bacterium]
MRFTIYGDGGSRGNPGPAGSGAIIRNEAGETVATVSEFLGVATNNVAEYTAVLRALEKLAAMLESKASEAEVRVCMDSMLVVKQMTGEWKLKHPGLKPLAQRVGELVRLFKSVSFEHVYRDFNKDADRLANEAMDRGR